MQTIQTNANAFPSLTWHHLRINHGTVDAAFRGPAELRCGTVQHISHAEFPVGGVPYAQKATTQMGAEFEAQFEAAALALGVLCDEFCVGQGAAAQEPLSLSLDAGSLGGMRDVVIHAGAGSSSSFVVAVRSASDASAPVALRVRVVAEQGATVSLSLGNLLGASADCYVAVGTSIASGACVRFAGVQLGAKKTLCGIRNELLGTDAEFCGNLSYIAGGGQELDINYVSHHAATGGSSSFATEGVLLGNAKKAWRGTIDFARGCSGSHGSENENVLLLSGDAENKSLPVILCDEEAVEGSHGTSIGRLDPAELFYLQTRGIDAVAARQLVVCSKVATASRLVPDQSLRQEIDDVVAREAVL